MLCENAPLQTRGRRAVAVPEPCAVWACASRAGPVDGATGGDAARGGGRPAVEPPTARRGRDSTGAGAMLAAPQLCVEIAYLILYASLAHFEERLRWSDGGNPSRLARVALSDPRSAAGA